MISVCFQSKPFNITVIQVYAPATDAEEAEVDRFYEDLDREDILEKESTPVLLPGKSHRQRSLVGYSPWGYKESDTTE